MKICVQHPNSQIKPQSNEVPVKLNELSDIQNSSCVSVYLSDCLDFIPLNERTSLIDIAILKLRQGGDLIIDGADIFAISHALQSGIRSIETLNNVLFNGKLSADSVISVVNYIEKNDNMKEISYKEDNLHYTIKARRKNANR